MKKITFITYTLLISITLISINACSPILVVGASAGAGATVVTDRRSAGKMVEDQAIEMQASDFIYSHKDMAKKVHVAVTSVNSTVLLTGEVPTQEFSNIIADKVNQMRPVKQVINKIKVRSKLPLSDRSNDTWVTSKVKTKLVSKKGLLSRTKVVTSNNHVYLMGMVNNSEAEEIIAIVKSIDGIENITPLFEPHQGQLQKSLTAANHTAKQTQAKKTLDERLEEEDAITMKPYVLPSNIKLTHDE